MLLDELELDASAPLEPLELALPDELDAFAPDEVDELGTPLEVEVDTAPAGDDGSSLTHAKIPRPRAQAP